MTFENYILNTKSARHFFCAIYFFLLVIQNYEFVAISVSLIYDLCPPKFGQFRWRLFAGTKTASEWFRVCLNGRSKDTCRRRTPVWSTQCRNFSIHMKRVWTRRLIAISWGRPFRQTRNRERICVRRTPSRNGSNVVVHKIQVKWIPLSNSAILSQIVRKSGKCRAASVKYVKIKPEKVTK